MRKKPKRESTSAGHAQAGIEGDSALQSVVANAAVPTFVADSGGSILCANGAFARLLGYAPAEIIGMGIANIVHPADAENAREQKRALAAGEVESYEAERRYLCKDGVVIWVLAYAIPFIDKRTGQFYITVQTVDINRQKRAEEALADSEKRWNSALECAGQGVWDHDLRNGRVFYSRTWREMRGFGLDEVIDGSREGWLARVHPDDRERVLNESIRQDSGELKRNDFEYRERHKDGRYLWVLSRGRPIEWMPDGSVARIIGTDTDITSIKLEEARAAAEAAEKYRQHLEALKKAHEATEAAHQLALKLARHDALTGLPNRRVLTEALDIAIKRAKRGGSTYAILSIDLDRFKPVNDVHGHAAGDAVLCEIANRLRDAVRESDTLARFGGDEFGVILEAESSDAKLRESATHLATRIIERIQEPIRVGDKLVKLGASVGIALCPIDGKTADALLSAADMAMYHAKGDGRGHFRFFEPSMEADLLAQASLEEDVRQAVAADDIRPHYQPLVQLAGNRLVGFEILARWARPGRGNVPPDTFIPVAERLGLIGNLTYSLLRRACLDAKHWPSDITIALNVSPTHFNDPLLPVKFLAILSETNFPPGRLEVEVTENALVSDLPAARTVLAALHDVGIKISLDDFGTGYSSLYHLRELRFDKIKIDRSFVTSMTDDGDRAKIVHSVLALAKSLGMPTIAEGIEQRQTVEALAESGAEYGQGFYFGKAVPASDADKLVQALDLKTHRRRA